MNPVRRIPLLLAPVLVALACTASAQASTVSINTEYDYLVVEGGRYADNLSVTPGAVSGTMTVTSRNDRLSTSGAGCTSVSASTATCTASVAGVYIGGAQGDDVLTLGVKTTKPSYVVAEDGNDVLRGGTGDDQLYGGLGNDDLDGGGGLDVVWGQEGADSVRSNDGVADTIVCGDGVDSVLADTVDAPPSDCETVQRPTSGTPAPPVGPGPTPTPTPGSSPAPGSPIAPVTIPAIAPALAPVKIAAKPVGMSTTGVVKLAMSCPSSEPRSCRGRITLRLRGGARTAAARRAPVIGRARFKVRPGATKQVRVKLSRNGRRRIIRRKRARCSVVARTPVSGGAARTRDQDVVVTAPKGSRR